MIFRFFFIILFLLPIKAFALIEVDITRGNLSPLPIAVSPLSIDIKSQKNFEKTLDQKNIGAEISLVNILTHATANTLGIAQTAGVILQSKEAANTVADRFTSATLKKTAINTWLLIGNLA